MPGPVLRQSISRSNGLTLHWDHPSNPNGELLYYSIEWNGKDGEIHSKNVSILELQYKFPDSIDLTKINITIRAVSTSGEGIPVYINLSNINQMSNISPKSDFDPTLGIVLGTVLSVLCVFFCIFCFIFNDRTCKKNTRNTIQNRSLPPMQSLTHCNTDMHEMQTLINKTKIGLIPNGLEKHINAVDKSSTRNIVIENDDTKENNHEQFETKKNYVDEIPPAPDDGSSKNVSSKNWVSLLLSIAFDICVIIKQDLMYKI